MRVVPTGLVLWVALSGAAQAADLLPESVDFDRDVRPVLADTCFKCHGPDPEQRVSSLRLDTKDGAWSELDEGRRAVVPGSLEQSELYRRITSPDSDERMPPADSGRQLSSHQVAILKRWIEQGARWQEHWALATPVRPALPPTQDQPWCRNPIDAFVLERLEQEGLQPSPEADRRTLIRRLSLDLTGLPPTPAEVDAFLADSAPQAYERLVDRLLRSSRYGERMALQWLDAARYADTSGYQNDGPRYMSRWRDWVIQAFNDNLPFDQFTIEQIAGDMLPNATLDQVVATGFNRNHRGNAEGGIIPEEYQVEYVVDRVDTVATVWLGMTMGCARCHDHKYDPIRQREFYQVFAYFNNVPEFGRAIKEGNSPPYVVAPTAAQRQELEQRQAAVAAAEQAVQHQAPERMDAQAAWERAVVPAGTICWPDFRGLIARFELNGHVTNIATGWQAGQFARGPGVFRSGVAQAAAELDGTDWIEAGDVGNFGYFDKFSLAAWIYPTADRGTIISRMTLQEQGDGYALHLEDGHLQVNLVKRWLDDATRVQSERRLEPGRWYHVAASYDGSRSATGIRVYVDGQPAALNTQLDALNQTFSVKEPLRIGGGHSPFQGAIDEVQIFDRDLSAEEVEVLANDDPIAKIVAVAPQERSRIQGHKLAAYFLNTQAPSAIREAENRLVRLRDELRQFQDALPTVMVMQEMSPPRETFVLVRGQYDKPGERVGPGVPAVFPPLPPGAPNNRLGFARWLVDPAHPLTARVAVNRFWQLYFGHGLVKTAEDFGVQGERPSHPALLDWLATEFVRSGWNVKELQKLIVTSATYRQSAKVAPELVALDPENRLMARGPRFRLAAETIRDQALFVSGLLVEKVGGPSVKPYQPDGLWKEIATDVVYEQSHGESLYRRSLYTYWKRTVAPPTMATFDATARESCTVKRSRTNTPLQALALMNDVTFMEAARALAERVLSLECSEPERIARVFRLAVARDPTDAERQVLVESLAANRVEFQQHPQAATELVRVGESKWNEQLDVGELAAYTLLCSLILNLDEVVTKE